MWQKLFLDGPWKNESQNELLSLNPLTCFRFRISSKANQSHWFYSGKTDYIYSIQRKREVSPHKKQTTKQPAKQTNTKTAVTTKYKETNRKEKQNKLYIPCPMLSWKVLSGIILLRWHQQVRLTSLNIIIKWCQMRQASTLLWSLLRITRKTHDTRT